MSHTFKRGDVVKRVDNSGFLRVTMPDFIEQRGFVKQVYPTGGMVKVMWLPDGGEQNIHHTSLMRATTPRKPLKDTTVPPWAREEVT